MSWRDDPPSPLSVPGPRVYERREELPEVVELVRRGWEIAPDAPSLSWLPAVFPRTHRTWVHDRSTGYVNEWIDGVQQPPQVLPEDDVEDLHRFSADCAELAGFPDWDPTRIWLLRGGSGVSVDRIVDRIHQDAGDVGIEASPELARIAARVVERELARQTHQRPADVPTSRPSPRASRAALTRAALTPGGPAHAVGLPIVVDGEPGLSLDEGRRGVVPLDSPHAVALTWLCDPPAPETNELVAVHGTWDGTRILVDRADPTGERRRGMRPPGLSSTPRPSWARPIPAERLAALSVAAGPLTEADLLAVGHPTRSGEPLGLLCVYDVPAARDVLAAAGVDPARFRVARCAWSRDDLARAGRLEERVPPGLLAGFGWGTNSEVQPIALLDLKYLTPELAEGLEAFPPGLVRARVHIAPEF